MIEIGDLANLYPVESGDINVNGDLLNQVLDMKYTNRHSGYGETFPQSHRFNMFNLPTTVHEGETPCKIGDKEDKNKTSVDVQRRKYAEHQEPHEPNICADIHVASEPNYLKINERIYQTEGRHKCDLCDYSSKWSTHLKAHKLLHTGKKPYTCDECDYSATRADHLKSHKLVHAGKKPYKCDICNFSFKRKGDLQRHKRIHSGESRYRCDLCAYSCARSDEFTEHKMVHSGEKPYACSLCEFSSKRKGDLKRHLLIHSRSRTNHVT